MSEIAPLAALAGGALIGLAGALLLLAGALAVVAGMTVGMLLFALMERRTSSGGDSRAQLPDTA